MEKIKNFAETHIPSETIKFIIKESGIETELKNSKLEEDLERLENVKELVSFVSKYDTFGDVSGLKCCLKKLLSSF